MHLLLARLTGRNPRRSGARPFGLAPTRGPHFVPVLLSKGTLTAALVAPMFLVLGGLQGKDFAEGTAPPGGIGDDLVTVPSRAVPPKRPVLRRGATTTAAPVEERASRTTASGKPTGPRAAAAPSAMPFAAMPGGLSGAMGWWSAKLLLPPIEAQRHGRAMAWVD